MVEPTAQRLESAPVANIKQLLLVNGVLEQIDAEPQRSLLSVLRDDLDLNIAK